MFTLFRNVRLSTLLATQVPALMVSFLIAELFFKFKSFTLECLAFLATWFVIDALVSGLRSVWVAQRSSSSRAG
jgi:hypothetical protein